MKSANNQNRFKAPSVEEIRSWSNDELTNLGWAYDRVRRASGERKMVVQNWFTNLNKRVDIIRKERNLI
jgi:hypothetical protein